MNDDDELVGMDVCLRVSGDKCWDWRPDECVIESEL